MAAPLPEDEARRLASLRALDILDTPPEERFDRITRAAASAFDVPICLVTLVDGERQWFKSRLGLPVAETAREHAFCAHAILGDDTFQVQDATRDPRFVANPLVTGDPGIRFYAGEPLTTLDGSKVGTLCIIDRKPRGPLTDEERDALRTLAARASDELSAERVRLGGYHLLEVVGRGGMGTVYRAQDDRLGRTVAVKILLREFARDRVFVERFRREARSLAKVAHPSVVTLFDVGEANGCHYMVCEWLPGGSLAARVRAQGRIPWPDACAHGAEIARALAAIHAAHLVHRDLKPGNVLFDASGRLKVTDFGLARTVAHVDPASGQDATVADPLTQAGRIVGTPAYTAPEQALGYEQVDGRADLYSLGATLYAVLTGAPPFAGKAYALMKQILSEPPRPLRDHIPHVPAELDRLVLHLLAKDPENRRSDDLGVAAELDALAKTSPGRSRPGTGRFGPGDADVATVA